MTTIIALAASAATGHDNSFAAEQAMAAITGDYATLEGFLYPGQSREHRFNASGAVWTLDLSGEGWGSDMDATVYDQYGDEIGSDTLPDNNPVVVFDVPFRQAVTVRVTNAGEKSGTYFGIID